MFVESYGQMAVEGTSVLAADRRRSSTPATSSSPPTASPSRSGWLTSSTYGGGSWLAHATLQSGVWVNSPGPLLRADQSKRLTLTAAFGRAGWRTVADAPATDGPGRSGHSFYHYDQDLRTADNLGYRGPNLRLLPDARPVRSPGAAEARAGEAEPAPCLRRRSTLTSSHDAVDPHPTAHPLEAARERIDLQPAADRPRPA